MAVLRGIIDKNMKTRERVIRIDSLVGSIALRWRALLVGGIICAILFAAIQMWRLRSDRTAEAVGQDDNLKKISEKTIEQQIKDVEQNIIEKSNYLQNSVLLKLNPNAVGEATIYLSVETDEKPQNNVAMGGIIKNTKGQITGSVSSASISDGRALRILNYYLSIISYDIEFDDIAEQIGVGKEYFQELITAQVNDEAAAAGIIQIVFTNEKEAGAIADFIVKYIETHKNEAETVYGKHNLIVEGPMLHTVADRVFNSNMKDRLLEINDLIIQRDNYKMNMASLITSDPETAQSAGITKSCIKYGIVEFLFGVAAGIALLAYGLVLSNKVLSVKEVDAQYDFDNLAVIPGEKVSYGLDAFIKRFILKEFIKKDKTVTYHIAASNICNKISSVDYVGQDGKVSVAIFGDVPLKLLEQVKTSLSAEEALKNIDFVLTPDLTGNPESLKSLRNSDAGILVAMPHKSVYMALDDMVRIVNAYKKEILGSIIILE